MAVAVAISVPVTILATLTSAFPESDSRPLGRTPRQWMAVPPTFSTPVLLRVAGTYEVRIETRDSPDSRPHRTVIWVVVDESRSAVYARSVRGDQGHWYRRLLANPQGAILIGDDRIPVTAVPVGPPEIERTTELLKLKYPPDQHLFAILRPHVVSATLRLDPR